MHQPVEVDVKARTKGEMGAAKTLCSPFDQPELPEGNIPFTLVCLLLILNSNDEIYSFNFLCVRIYIAVNAFIALHIPSARTGQIYLIINVCSISRYTSHLF